MNLNNTTSTITFVLGLAALEADSIRHSINGDYVNIGEQFNLIVQGRTYYVPVVSGAASIPNLSDFPFRYIEWQDMPEPEPRNRLLDAINRWE